MMNLGLPHVSVLSKCDLVMDKKQLKKFIKHLEDVDLNKNELPSSFSDKYIELTKAVKSVIEEYNLVSLLPLDITDEETVKTILYHADSILQYDEYVGPIDKYYDKIDEMNME